MADSVTRSFKVLAVARLAAQAITWLITLIVISLLSPADYGLMALVGIVIGLFTLVNDVGLSAALIQKQSVDVRLEKAIFGAMILLNGALFAAIFLISTPVAAFFTSPGLAEILPVCGLQLLLNPIITFTDAKLRREMRFTEKSRIEFVAGVSGGIAALALAYSGFGVWALVAGMLAVGAVRAVMGFITCGGVPVPSFRFQGLGEALGFGGYITADRIMWFLSNQSDVFLAGRLLGQELLGLYAIAYQLVSLPMQKLSTILNDVGFAGFSRLQDDLELAKQSYMKATRLTAFFAFPVFIGLGVIAPQLVQLVLGDTWALSGQLMMLMCFAFPFKMMNTVSNNVLLGLGHVRLVAGFGLFGLVVMPASYAFAIYTGGLEALAMAVPLVAIVQFAVVSVPTTRQIEISYATYIGRVALPAGIALVMGGVVILLGNGLAGMEGAENLVMQAAILAVCVAVGAGVFALIAFALARDVFGLIWSILRA